jgi:hypothetical protein
LTQTDDYWKFGPVQIIVGGQTYNRKIEKFDAATDTLTFDVELPTAASSGDSYSVKKGCPGTWDACSHSYYAYGPSAYNVNNFLGFIHLGKISKVGKFIASYGGGYGGYATPGGYVGY